MAEQLGGDGVEVVGEAERRSHDGLAVAGPCECRRELGFAGPRLPEDHDRGVARQRAAQLVANRLHARRGEQVFEAQVVLVVVLGSFDSKVFARGFDQSLLCDHAAEQRPDAFDEIDHRILFTLALRKLEIHRPDEAPPAP